MFSLNANSVTFCVTLIELQSYTLRLSWNNICYKLYRGQCLVVKNLPINAGDLREWVRSLGQGDLLEEEMASHSNILYWRIP